MRWLRALLQFKNPRELCSGLREIDPAADVDFIEDAIAEQTKAWLRLAEKHLKTADVVRASAGADWRSVVSRSYYAAYTTARALRFYVAGTWLRSSADHKAAADLPSDFPDRDRWHLDLVAMRDDRNKADYDPWSDTYWQLEFSPDGHVLLAGTFMKVARRYLRGRGLAI